MSEDNKVLMKNNLLIQAKYNLNLVENRIFTTLLYKFQKNQKGIYSCQITHDELKILIKNTNKSTLKGVENVLESLMNKKITVKEMGQIDKWHTYSLIGGYTYDNGIFTVESLPKIYDLLKDYYDSGYTPINLVVLLGMNNYYGQRFYELLRLWSGTKRVINYEVEYIKECFDIKDKYSNFKDFRKRVLDPGIKALNDTGYFEIEIKENKVGRKVDSIDFIVKDLDKRVYFDTKEIVSIDTNDFNSKKSKIDEFYIPNKKLFTTKTLSDFKNNFKEYNFKDSAYKKILQEAIIATLEKDDAEKIYAKSYNYFKKTLENKLNDLFTKENNNEFKKTKFHNFDETFTKYSEDEFEELILRSQKKKFG